MMKIKSAFLITLLLSVCCSAFCQNSNIDKGLNAEKLGLQDRALSYYQQAAADAPDDAVPQLLIGKLQLKRHHYDEAAIALRQATTLNDTLGEAYERLVFSYIENGDFDGSRSGHFNGVDELLQLAER